MTPSLLWRGMLAGLVGAFVAATVALLFAEPSIDAAIAFEAARSAHHMGGEEVELVSRATQKTYGLYTAMLVYGAALGGVFAILFAGMQGRVGRTSPRGLALLLGLAGFVAIGLVPALIYPPNPPAVGLHETVRLRTAACFALIAWSLVAAAGSLILWQRLAARLTAPDRLLAAGALYAVLIALAAWLLPHIDEVPAGFPASLLWRFRLASLAVQGVFWLAMADLFGRSAERLLQARPA